MKHTIKSILLATAVTFGTVCAQASTSVKSNFIVKNLSANPGFAHNTTQDMLLHDGNDDSTYSYAEQQGAAQAVFDVTGPAQIKFTTSVYTQPHGTHDFATPIGGSAESIAFCDGSGTAVLDLRMAKTPRVTAIEESASVPTEILGTAGRLYLKQKGAPTASAQPRDIQLVENNQTPRLLTTVTGVTKQIARAETGTVFLMGEGKITVIRRMDAERRYASQQDLNKN